MGQLINISVCLTDLPADKITKSEKNGKKYITLIVDERKEADNYGNTHSVSVGQTKEERERKEKKVYVGNGKAYMFGEVKQNEQPPAYMECKDANDDLPF